MLSTTNTPLARAIGGITLEQSLAVALILAASYALLVLMLGLNAPLLDGHAFRQTQTAISVYWILHGGNWLAYETPVLGSPWTIPFEAPIYEWSVAVVYRLMPIGLDAAGRITSFLYLLGSVAVGVKALRLLIPDDRRLPIIFSLLLLTSPQYLFWGRTFMIETCAVFYCLVFLYAAMRFYRQPHSVIFILMLSTSLIGILAKVTTWPGYVLAFGLFWATETIKQRRVNFAASSGVAVVCVASVIAGLLWNAFSDDLKVQSLLGRHVTSSALSIWNFGKLSQRFSGDLWKNLVPTRMLPDALGTWWPVLLVAIAQINRSSAYTWVAVAGTILFLTPVLLFTNLHIWHDYYQTANSIFLIVGVAALLAELMKDSRWRIGLSCLGLIVLGQISVFSTRLNSITQNFATHPSFVAARAAREMIPPNRGLYVFGVDWSSELHYYAERKGIAFPSWLPRSDLIAALENPSSVLGEYPFGGVIDCRSIGPKLGAPDMAIIDEFVSKLISNGATRREVVGCVVYATSRNNP